MKTCMQYYRLILLLILVQLSGCGGVDEGERFQRAQAGFEQGAYSEAIIDLKNILQANTKHQGARILLSRCYLSIGDGVSA
jgi:thioredoxin-like negative regulator of GroEL